MNAATPIAVLCTLFLVVPAGSAREGTPRTWPDPPPSASAGEGLAPGIVAELNTLRADPAGYARVLEGWRAFYRGDRIHEPGEIPVATREGVRAVDEAITALRGTKPLPPLRVSSGLARAAAVHAADLSAHDHVGHRGSDGSRPAERMSRFGRWRESAGEAIAFGSGDARHVVIQLLIDDGVPDRGHRRLLLRPDLRVAGAGCAAHPTFRQVCVVDLAVAYDER